MSRLILRNEEMLASITRKLEFVNRSTSQSEHISILRATFRAKFILSPQRTYITDIFCHFCSLYTKICINP